MMLPLEAAIAPPLKLAGFKKNARTWSRHNDETVQMINLQKSQFCDDLYVNFGVYVKRLGTERSPSSRHCHVNARLEGVTAFCEHNVAAIKASAFPTPAHIDAVLIDGSAWLAQVSTLAGLRRYLDAGGSQYGPVHASVHSLVAEQNDA